MLRPSAPTVTDLPEDDSAEIPKNSDEEVSDKEESDEEVLASKEEEKDESEKTFAEREEKRALRDRTKIKRPSRYRDCVTMSTTLEEPDSYSAAIKSDKRAYWKEGMDLEMKALRENRTWVLEDLPPGKKAIPCRWVYKVKTCADGSVDKYKARLVIKGFSQKKGVDYDQTFSPVAKMSTIRTLLSVAAKKKMKLAQIDVSTAFLYGDLEEVIYMKQPKGYDDGSGKVCRLIKSLYGLKQGPRCWNEKFSKYLIKLGFKKSRADPCLFVKRTNSAEIFFALYVDDGLIAANSEKELQQFISDLKREFKITSKPASFYLGLEIDRKEDGSIHVTQKHYTEKILERFKMDNCRSVSMPMIADKGTDEEESPVQTSDFPHRQAVGSLMRNETGHRISGWSCFQKFRKPHGT